MLAQILTHMPSWVFVLFFVLLALGYWQTKAKTLSRRLVFLLPVVMLGLSFFGVLSAFGMTFIVLIAWLVGIFVAVGAGIKAGSPREVTFSPETQMFFVPGSWIPLILMMAIFFTKFVVGVIMARGLVIVDHPVFACIIGFCYGLFSGIFLARAIVIWRYSLTRPK